MKIRKAEVQDMPELLNIYNYEVEYGTATFDLNTKTMEERMEWFHAHNQGNHLLMAEILEIAKQRSDIHTVISVITDGNDASVALHEDFGFEYCGTMKEVGKKFGKMLGIVNYQFMAEP